MRKDRLIVILGPTAVGKTQLAIDLAKRLHTEIISGDSMLVYRGFDIGSAKPTREEQGAVVHHLIDILPPEAKFSVTEFQERAGEIIHRLNAQGKIPILAGGTGLYIKSLVEGYCFNEIAGDPAYRKKIEDLAEEKGKAYVHTQLAKVDPQTAARLHVNDFRRVVRALEVWHLGGEKISQEKMPETGELIYDACLIGLRRERSALYERINQRVNLMFAAGLEEEVRTLLASGISRDAQAMQGIGYKEVAAYLAGEGTREEALRKIQQSTRHFAKRQMTWYRKMPYIHWIDADSLCELELLEKVSTELAGTFGKK